jgi:hypothetical protein
MSAYNHNVSCSTSATASINQAFGQAFIYNIKDIHFPRLATTSPHQRQHAIFTMSAGMLATALLSAFIPAVLAQSVSQDGVVATFPNGATNPAAPSFAEVGSIVDQKSMSRLLSLNGVDDFCLYGPPEAGPESLIGNIEPIAVSYCSKARNGARIIPDGTIHSAHFVKTDMYVQIQGKRVLVRFLEPC